MPTAGSLFGDPLNPVCPAPVDGEAIVFAAGITLTGACPAVLARLVAVPCNSLEPDLGNPLSVGEGFSAGLGFGLVELSLERTSDPVALPREVLCRLLEGVLVDELCRLSERVPAFSDGVPVGLRAFARLDAVGLFGEPVTWALSAAGEEVEGVCREGPVWNGTSLRVEVEGVRFDLVT